MFSGRAPKDSPVEKVGVTNRGGLDRRCSFALVFIFQSLESFDSGRKQGMKAERTHAFGNIVFVSKPLEPLRSVSFILHAFVQPGLHRASEK